MAYKKDEDLEFLKEIPNEQLDVLVECLVKDPKDKQPRLSESLTKNDSYKHNSPNHQAYWFAIAEELQLFGGNTVFNAVRGGGVLYREILIDVAEKLKVNFNKASSTQVIEGNLLQKMIEESVSENDSMDDLLEMAKNLNINVTPDLTKQALVGLLQAAIKAGGFPVYKTALIVANAIARLILGRGLMMTTNAALTRTISIFSGPIGWAITCAWTLLDIASPAFRVTIPAVCYIAAMRAVYNEQKEV